MPAAVRCPVCCGPLHRVTNDSGMLNSEQFDSVKAGDWYCDQCPESAGRAGKSHAGYAYFWDSQVDADSCRCGEKAFFEHAERECDAVLERRAQAARDKEITELRTRLEASERQAAAMREALSWMLERPLERRCGQYLGDNDATCPQLICIRPRGHTGLHSNVVSDRELAQRALSGESGREYVPASQLAEAQRALADAQRAAKYHCDRADALSELVPED